MSLPGPDRLAWVTMAPKGASAVPPEGPSGVGRVTGRGSRNGTAAAKMAAWWHACRRAPGAGRYGPIGVGKTTAVREVAGEVLCVAGWWPSSVS